MSATASQLRSRRSAPPQVPLRVVNKRTRRPSRRASREGVSPAVAIASVCIVAVVAAVLLEQVILAQSAFELSRLRDRLTEAEEDHQHLLLQATQLGSPGRIERYARDELGMVDPDPTRTEYVVARVRDISVGSIVASARSAGPLRAGGVAAGVDP